MKPPIAPQKPHTVTVHDLSWDDPYFWLRERENPEVIAYLEAENAFTKETMAHTESLQETLYQEMRGRIKETDLSVPYRMGDYQYYNRMEEGKQYPIFCRKGLADESGEEILLDQNALAEGQEYFQVGVLKISPNHQLLAYSTDFDGSEQYTLFVKDLNSGELLADRIPSTSYSAEWGNDNETIFYTTLDETRRPFRLHRHTLNTEATADIIIHQEDDDKYFLDLYRTLSGQYLVMLLNSSITTEIHYVPAQTPLATWQLLYTRENGIQYYLFHHGDRFYIRTNKEAVNYKLVSTPVSDPSEQNWQMVIAPKEDVKLTAVTAFQKHLVITTREDGLEKFRILNLDDGTTHHIDFPEPTYAIWTGDNYEFNSEIFRFRYSSLVTPMTVFDYNMNDRSREQMKQDEVIGYDGSLYESTRVWATAVDGVKVPISLVHRRGLKLNGQNPLHLTGYGSYGASYPPLFGSNRISLLDRGFVFAIAHIRGGGEMGEQWRNDGKMLKKKNTFTDFIACSEHLIQLGYTSIEKLAVSGGSAGGLLMGAVVNMRPDIFQAVIAQVPFVDVINTMLDDSIPLTVVEYEEWGNPNDRQYFDYMRSYSPYDNVEAKDYPHLLLTAGLNDPRVQYWEPAKWIAKLRQMKTDDNTLIMKTNMGAGHGGASGRFDRLKELALEYAFILDRLGLTIK